MDTKYLKLQNMVATCVISLLLATLLLILRWVIFGDITYAAPQVFTVTNTNASGAGSLFQAVADANTNNNPSDQDRIEFNIPLPGTVTIAPFSTMTIEEPVIIDGYTQGDASPNTAVAPYPFNGRIRVEIDNSTTDQIWINSDNVTFRGLSIYEGANGNIRLQQGSNNFKLFGSYLDVRADGLTYKKTNTDVNSLIIEDSSDVQVGGALAAERNIFANCSQSCIYAEDAGTTNLHIKGNYIGLGADGLTSLDNYAVGGLGGVGIHAYGISSLVIGGDTPAEGNSIERNYWGGVKVEESSNVQVLGNRILFNFNADVHGNEGEAGGVFFGGVQNSVIGNTSGGANTIAGNRNGAVKIGNTQNASSNITIEGNRIGVMPDGTTAFSNTEYGILVTDYASGVRIAENIIANTAQFGNDRNFGIEVDWNASLVSILNNSIYNNFSTGIEVRSSETPIPTYSEATESGGDTLITYGFAAPAGNYRIEFFSNDQLDASGAGEGQTRIGYDDITSSGSYMEITHTLEGIGHENISLTATPFDEDGVGGFGTTSEFGGLQLQSDLEITTEDDTGFIAENSTNHEITQTITNTGPATLGSIDFSILTSDCFNLNTVGISGTATTLGLYNSNTNDWTGLLEAGQSLILTFTGDITGCTQGDTSIFTHYMVAGAFNEIEVNDFNQTNNQYSNYTDVITPVDLAFETTDGVNSVLTTVGDHQITQTITNQSSTTVTDIAFQGIWLSCATLDEVQISGTATNTGTYNESENEWNGALAPGEFIVLTFSVTLTCTSGDLTLQHNVNFFESSGVIMNDLNLDNNDYSDSTTIQQPVTDFSLTKVLSNPESLAVGEPAIFDLTFTNNGPQPFDISLFSGTSPVVNQLFLAMLPAELDYVSAASNDGLACSSFGAGSASGFGSALANHSDYTVVSCYVVNGSDEYILDANESISLSMTVEPNNNSDLTFTSYALANFGYYDSDVEAMNSLGNNDIIDYLRSQPINNFAIGGASVDVAIEKTLLNPEDVQPGNVISYQIGLTNKGPMDLELETLYNTLSIFTEIYPGTDLAFVDSNDDDIQCQDYGPGSHAYLGLAGSAHPSHQLMTCSFVGSDAVIEATETYTFELNFLVNNTLSSQFTNFVSAGAVPSDPDVVTLNQLFATATNDILDTITNENFAKHTYTNPDFQDSDGDGVRNGIENAGPNNGDANNDGILDSNQSNVASSINSVTNKPVTLVVDGDCDIIAKNTLQEDSLQISDPTYSYPLGLIGFTLQCLEPGTTSNITIYYHQQQNNNFELRKHKQNNYFTIEDASIAFQSIAGSNTLVVSYAVTDGGSLDSDGAVDGAITDPVGIAQKESWFDQLSATGENIYIAVALITLLATTGISAVAWFKKGSKHEI